MHSSWRRALPPQQFTRGKVVALKTLNWPRTAQRLTKRSPAPGEFGDAGKRGEKLLFARRRTEPTRGSCSTTTACYEGKSCGVEKVLNWPRTANVDKTPPAGDGRVRRRGKTWKKVAFCPPHRTDTAVLFSAGRRRFRVRQRPVLSPCEQTSLTTAELYTAAVNAANKTPGVGVCPIVLLCLSVLLAWRSPSIGIPTVCGSLAGGRKLASI